jgi:hypothetical protein
VRRRTSFAWCNAPQPGNWQNACQRLPGHEGDHAVRKSYRASEAFAWPDGYPVRSCSADHFPDLWSNDPLYDPPAVDHPDTAATEEP